MDSASSGSVFLYAAIYKLHRTDMGVSRTRPKDIICVIVKIQWKLTFEHRKRSSMDVITESVGMFE